MLNPWFLYFLTVRLAGRLVVLRVIAPPLAFLVGFSTLGASGKSMSSSCFSNCFIKALTSAGLYDFFALGMFNS